ncbi:MAG: glycoside hydrolase family 97 protein [Muribaculum sp.]|nr:glycoside hydrolase family 97 protein [Muribaculum sp.]
MKLYPQLGLCLLSTLALTSYAMIPEMSSPDKSLTLNIDRDSLSITVYHGDEKALEIPVLGLISSRNEAQMSVDSIGPSELIVETYTMPTGKRSLCSNEAFERIVYLSDSIDHRQKIRIRLYNDGLAFRYELDNLYNDSIIGELTSYRISKGTPRWIQRWIDSYEDFYPMSDSADISNRHLAYPALINSDTNTWCLISEANIERRQSASALFLEDDAMTYRVLPAQNEAILNGEWHTPWRIAIIGTLDDVVESTLITDVSNPPSNLYIDSTWIRPGLVSWVYWAHNHGSRDYDTLKKYVDMAVDMGLPYTLIDAEWDEMTGGNNIEDILQYSVNKGVSPLIWYNSSVGWINGAPGPKFRLNNSEDRNREFDWCVANGIKGAKIDFFSGDSEMNMSYMIDLLESAAEHKMLVNFHGATIPRGWQRTYPNLMSMEGVYGAEWYNNAPVLTEKAARHNATLPFTRNVVGPMDYTPVTFSDSQYPHITSNAHELALSVVFESALQHLADRPESYSAQPDAVRKFLSTLPTAWDDTRLLGGYPGEYIVIARRKGDSWYIGALNGVDSEKSINLYLDEIINPAKFEAQMYEDSSHTESTKWKYSDMTAIDIPTTVICRPRGGFVIKLSPL